MGALVIMSIPFRSFREKINITKQYRGMKMQIFKDFVIVEMRG